MIEGVMVWGPMVGAGYGKGVLLGHCRGSMEGGMVGGSMVGGPWLGNHGWGHGRGVPW